VFTVGRWAFMIISENWQRFSKEHYGRESFARMVKTKSPIPHVPLLMSPWPSFHPVSESYWNWVDLCDYLDQYSTMKVRLCDFWGEVKIPCTLFPQDACSCYPTTVPCQCWNQSRTLDTLAAEVQADSHHQTPDTQVQVPPGDCFPSCWVIPAFTPPQLKPKHNGAEINHSFSILPF
jgi:hypothetical protein